MGVLDSLREEVYSTKSLKTYELIRSSVPLLKAYPSLDSFLDMMWASGPDAAKIKDQYFIVLIRMVQEKRHTEIIQLWLLYLFGPKLKTLLKRFNQVEDGEFIWEALRVINEFRLWSGRRYIAQRLSKNIENAIIRICKKLPETDEILFIDTRQIKSSAEPVTSPDQLFEADVPEITRLVNVMNQFGISDEVQFILLRILEGKTLTEISEICGKKYDTIQKALFREKQRLREINAKKLEKK